MKRLLCLLLLVSASLITPACKKNKPAINQLPPETQTGASTFGCLVDGKVFKPKGDPFGGPILSCAYQYVNGGYYLQLFAKRDESATVPTVNSVSIGTDSLMIEEGKVYRLTTERKGTTIGQYSSYTNNGFIRYFTNDLLQGEIFIKKFDQINRIISGTFWFDAVNPNGEKVEVREGRFDMNYTL